MVVMDDVGVDSLGVYPVNPRAGSLIATPTIRRLAETGIVFDNAWSNPVCSPTRATLLTGRYAFRTGVTGLVGERSLRRLPLDELTIPQVLTRLPELNATSAAFGKWHLANCLNGCERHPNLAGFSYFAGQIHNLRTPNSYFYWPKTVNGTTAPTATYSTTDNVDEASAWIRSQGPDRPWFVYLAFNSAHWGPSGVWQVPPHELLPEGGKGLPRAGESCGESCRRKMIEAMDRELGRLLREIEAERGDTTIMLVSDNGTDPEVRPEGSPYPAGHQKFSLYEGGINVPLIISGSVVADPGTRSSALVDASDLFSTAIELVSGRSIAAALPGAVLDSRSLVPILDGSRQHVRNHAFASLRTTQFAIRNARYKLIRGPGGDQLYDMLADRHTESNDLLRRGELGSAERASYQELTRELDGLIAPVRSACPPVAGCSDCSREAAAACSETAKCRLIPAAGPGMKRCLLRDGTPFSCESGTIHVRSCECEGPVGHCVGEPLPGGMPPAPRTSQMLVCS
jgi:arylsulfatase A-like enzyme